MHPTDLDAVRESYDRAADNYVAMRVGSLGPNPWLRAALNAFAEEVRDLGPVLDVGCGPGTVTTFLADRGVDVSGLDLSPKMVEHARRLHPDLQFAVGSATDALPECTYGGLLGWWSLFNLPRVVLADVVDTFARALVPGGQLLLGTHVGEGEVERTAGYDVPVRWTTHLWQPEELCALVTATGLEPVAQLRLPPANGRKQVVLAARKPLPVGP